jgi:hypothetical protein
MNNLLLLTLVAASTSAQRFCHLKSPADCHGHWHEMVSRTGYSSSATQEFGKPVPAKIGNPLHHIDVGDRATPIFADTDNDGDLDLYVGNAAGEIKFFKNVGNEFTEQTGNENPCHSIFVGIRGVPTFADTDNDGDLDLYVSVDAYPSKISFHENVGSVTQPIFLIPKFVDLLQFGSSATLPLQPKPIFVDLDKDGDLDLVVGGELKTKSGSDYSNIDAPYMAYFKNTGNRTFTQQFGINNPFNGILFQPGVKSESPAHTPVFVDVDHDGDLDMYVGGRYGGTVDSQVSNGMLYFKNVGSETNPAFEWQSVGSIPFKNTDLGTYTNGGYFHPTVVDNDNDGDMDVYIGNVDGKILYYENKIASRIGYTQNVGDDNAMNSIDVGRRAVPVLVDTDGDGDLDLYIGAEDEASIDDIRSPCKTNCNNGQIYYFKNEGSDNLPKYVQMYGANNPFAGVEIGLYAHPTFGDIDNDGDLDAYVGTTVLSPTDILISTLLVFENTGNVSHPIYTKMLEDANPFPQLSLTTSKKNLSPSLVDINNDGNLDMFVSFEHTNSQTSQNGGILFFLNSGAFDSHGNPIFTEKTGNDNPLNIINSGTTIVGQTIFFDKNGDGDLDVFIGVQTQSCGDHHKKRCGGTIGFYENLGNNDAGIPIFMQQQGAQNPFNWNGELPKTDPIVYGEHKDIALSKSMVAPMLASFR